MADLCKACEASPVYQSGLCYLCYEIENQQSSTKSPSYYIVDEYGIAIRSFHTRTKANEYREYLERLPPYLGSISDYRVVLIKEVRDFEIHPADDEFFDDD